MSSSLIAQSCKLGLGTALPAHCPSGLGSWQEHGPCSATRVLQAQGLPAGAGSTALSTMDLHALSSSRNWRVVQLGAKMKRLMQGTEERKASSRPGHDDIIEPCSGPAHLGFVFQALEATIVQQYHYLKVRLDAGHLQVSSWT